MANRDARHGSSDGASVRLHWSGSAAAGTTNSGCQAGTSSCRWRRSTMAAAAVMPLGSAMSACRSFGTGCCGSTRQGRMVWSIARRWAGASAERRPSRGVGGRHRERSDPCRPQCRALASGRSLPVAMGRVPGQHSQTNAQPRTTQSGLPQAHRPAPPSRSGGGSDRAF